MQNFSAEFADEIRGRPGEPIEGAARHKSPAPNGGLGAGWFCPTSQLVRLDSAVGAPGVDRTACEMLFPGGGR